MAQFVSKFAEPGEPEYAPPVPETETPVIFSSFLSPITEFLCICFIYFVRALSDSVEC